MNHLFWAIFTLFLSSGCSSPTSKFKPEDDLKPVSFFELKNSFKYSNLKEFEIESIGWESLNGAFLELDSAAFYSVWQNGEKSFVEDGEDRNYFFSWQDRDTNFYEFTILSQEASENCIHIIYCIHDKAGKEIDKFIASSSCGDAGWYYEASGKFINPSAYEMLSVEYQLNEDVPIEKGETFDGDSIVYHVTIDEKGKASKKEISKTHFTGKH